MTFTTQALVEGPVFDAALRFAADGVSQREANTTDLITKMGWAATLIAEQDGGSGGSLEDLVAIIDALGQHAIQLPLLERCALAPLLLAAVEQPDQRREWLSAIAAGTCVISTLNTTKPDLGGAALSAVLNKNGDAYVLNGSLLGASQVAHATHYLLLAQQEKTNMPMIFLINAAEIPEPIKHYHSIDGFNTVDIVFTNHTTAKAHCLVQGSSAAAAIEAAKNMAVLATSIDIVAALGSLLERTIQYLKTRTQFDVALASFQALRHRTVEMYVRFDFYLGLLQ